MRAAAKVADPGDTEGRLWANMRIHRITSEAMLELGYSSKLLAEWAFFCKLRDEGRRAADAFLEATAQTSACAPRSISTPCSKKADRMGLLGILLGLGVLVWLSFRGWSVLLLAPVAGLIASAAAGEPLLAHWTQTFMGSAAGFLAQFFPLFLLGALFGKLMEDSGSVTSIARFMTEKLGPQRAILAVVLAGALVTYGGVSLFVAFFVLGPMAQALFRAANIPNRLMPAAIALGTSTFTMSALPGTPAIQNAIPMPFFGTTPFAAPGLGVIAAFIMAGFGLWWLARAEAAARRAGEGYGGAAVAAEAAAEDPLIRARATTAGAFDPAEVQQGHQSTEPPGICLAVLPLLVVVLVNLVMSLVVLPRIDAGFLADERWGGLQLTAVSGVWSVIVALAAAIVVLVACNLRRLPALRATVDAGANASVLPVLSVASLVGFGAVVAAMPAFVTVRDWVLASAAARWSRSPSPRTSSPR